MKNILITGGAGFIGCHLAIKIRERFPSYHVVALDNLSRRGSETNVCRLKGAGVEFIKADVRRSGDLSRAARRVSLIIEASAEPSILAGYADPQRSVSINLLGAFQVLELARSQGAGLIFLSSSRVYPVPWLEKIPLRETKTRFVLSSRPSFPGISKKGVSERFPLSGYRSLYGATKMAAELLIQEYAQSFGLRSVINRCSVVSGPGQFGRVDQGVFGYWMLAHYFHQELAYFGFGGQGKQVRDLLHVDDLAELIMIQMKTMSRYRGEIFNVGGGEARTLSLREATTLCQDLTGNQVRIQKVLTPRIADVPLYFTNNGEVTQATGWRPRRTPRQTLTDLRDWIRENEKILARMF